MEYTLAWLKEAGAKGLIADVTGRLGGAKTEVDFPGRGPGESKLRLLKTSEIKNCLPPKDIHTGDTILIFNGEGKVLHAGTVTAEGRIRHVDGSVSILSVAAYCSRWRTAAGVMVLREPWQKYRYTKRECYVPMRDGTRLYTAVYEPAGLEGRPIILQRSPYPCCPFGSGGPGDLWDNLRMFTDNGYIVVFQNVRGTFMSEGEFENVRPLDGVCDEASDTYDTIDWLLANTSSNGNVGIFGVSYPGFYATLASVCGHPALKATSPQAPVTDWWKGDDTHHNGAFMLSDMYGFGSSFFRPKDNPTPDSKESLSKVPEGCSIYDFFKGKSMRQIFRAVDSVGFFKEIKAHPDYDTFWKERCPLRHLKDVKPAVLVVGGLYDAEDAYGAIATYKALKEQSPATESYLAYGPWTHGGWRNVDYFLEEVEYPFFAYYLEGKGSPPPCREMVFPTGIETLMMVEDPLPQVRRTFPIAAGSYVSDPADPVPYMESDASWRDKAYMWAPQNFAAARKDVLSRVLTRPLKDTLWGIGPVKVHLEASIDGTDADFVVKLIDLAPDGTQTLVRGDVMPARWRRSPEKAEAVEPGRSFGIDFEMNGICHCFAPGHRIMVHIQSSWFPLVAMNPQTFLENPYSAARRDYRACKVSIRKGSYISFGVRN